MLLGDGAGAFSGYATFRYLFRPEAIDVADLDRNGTKDIVALHNGAVDVLLTGLDTSLDYPTSVQLDVSDTLAATVSSATSPWAQTGAVRFEVDDEILGIVPVDKNGQATTTIAKPMSLGGHMVTATFLRDDIYASSSATAQYDVVKTRTVVSFDSVNPANGGDPLTVTIGALDPTSGTTPPSGTFTLQLDGAFVRTLTFANMPFHYQPPALSTGAHTIDVTYSGDAHYESGTFSYLQYVTQRHVLIAFDAPNPSPVSRPITMTAKLSYAGIAPTGTYTLKIDGTAVKTFTFANWPLAYPLPALPIGRHTIAIAYSGDANYAAQTFSYDQIIAKAHVNIAFTSTNPSPAGQAVVLTMNMTREPGAATGSFTLKLGSKGVKTFTFSSTAIRYTSTALAAGTYIFTVTYPGDAKYEAASYTYTQTVTKTKPKVTLTVRPTSTNTATTVFITASLPSTATGRVSFYAGTTRLGTFTLSRGKATLSKRFSAGTYAIRAEYTGDTKYTPAVSANVTLTVVRQ